MSGWGGTAPSSATVLQPASPDEVGEVLATAADEGRRVIARGLGRSYGDAAQCAGGTVLDLTALDRVLHWDSRNATLKVQAGTSLDSLMRLFVPRGFFVRVTPGTRNITVGGAVAADIHGKNHHADGSFCSHVEELTLATPSGIHRLARDDADPRSFWATAGGMGMTGVVVDVTMRLLPIETSYLRVDTERAADLDDLMSRLSHLDAEHRYSVAWVDCLAKGTELGRGVVTGADHALWGDLESRPRRSALDFAPRRARRVPFQAPSGLLNSFTVTAFNELWFRKAPRHGRGQLQGISPFFHPLDGVGSWNRLYGRRGFVQYQFVVPPASAEVVRQVLERLRKASVPAFLGVLKRFGPGNPGPLSFPMEGWTLALDLPLTSAGLGKVLDGLDELVAGAGGRVYLAKDARLRPELVEVMYPGLRDWRPRCHELDPLGVMDSDLARRLDLMGRCRGSR